MNEINPRTKLTRSLPSQIFMIKAESKERVPSKLGLVEFLLLSTTTYHHAQSVRVQTRVGLEP